MVLWQFAAQTMPTVPNSFIAFKMVLGLLRALNLASFVLYNSVVQLQQVGCPVCRNYSWHQKQNGKIQLNKTVLTFFIFFFLPWIPSTYSRIYASSAKYALKNLPRVSQIFFICNHNKKHLLNGVSSFCIQTAMAFWEHKSDLPAWGFTQTYKKYLLIGLRIWVIELIFFCVGVATFPANVVESTVGAVVTPHDWQGIEGDSFWGVGVMINGIEGEGGQCAARWNRHHGGQDESQAIGHVLVGRAGQSWRVTYKPRESKSFI